MEPETPPFRPQVHRLFYRVPQLAAATGLSNFYIRQEIQDGKLKAGISGQVVVISHDGAMDWLYALPFVGAHWLPDEAFPPLKRRPPPTKPFVSQLPENHIYKEYKIDPRRLAYRLHEIAEMTGLKYIASSRGGSWDVPVSLGASAALPR